jgi:hypothetical protein
VSGLSGFEELQRRELPYPVQSPTPFSPSMASREDALASLAGRLRPLTAPLRRGARASGNSAPGKGSTTMTEKSHVSLEQRACLVCGNTYDTGSILLDRHLKASLEQHTVTGWGLCPEHKKIHEEGFIALIEVDPGKSERPDANDILQPWQVYRTGVVTYMRREAFLQLFDIPDSQHLVPCVFVEPKVTELIKSRVAEAATH